MGFCNHRVHHKCQRNMNASLAKVMANDRNLFWMCDECAKLMNLARFRNAGSSLGNIIASLQAAQEGMYAELRKEISRNGEKLNQLSSRLQAATKPAPPIANRQFSDFARAPKRKRGEDAGYKPSLVLDKKIVQSDKAVTVPPPEELFWLYVTRFLNDTTPTQVMSYVKEVIGENEQVQAFPLVKKGVDPSTLNYISFKVGVATKHKAAVMNPEVWPGGCAFREFDDVQLRSENTRKSASVEPSASATTASSSVIPPNTGAAAWSTPRSENSMVDTDEDGDSDHTMMDSE